MNKWIRIFSMVLVITSCTNNKMIDSNVDFVGLWQYPNRSVWVEIKSDGSVYQCRIDKNGSVISSLGKLYGDRTIHWQQVWQSDQIRRARDTIYLKGVYGEFGFDRAGSLMIDKCQNPIAN